MKQYLDLLKDILENGNEREDRTGVGTISVFGRQIRFKMSDGFPAVTTKSLAWRAVVSELLWFLEGSTSEHRLAELGPVYGKQWRNWLIRDNNGNKYSVDQITPLINKKINNPTSRRLMVNAWNVGELGIMALPPCHYGFQFYVDGDKLSLMFNMRSTDEFLGAPFNIASYALLLHIIARMTGKIPYELIGNFGDAHIYKNHLEQVKEQIKRTPHKLPTLKMPDLDYQNMTIDEVLKSVKTSDFVLENYEHDGVLKAPMAV